MYHQRHLFNYQSMLLVHITCRLIYKIQEKKYTNEKFIGV